MDPHLTENENLKKHGGAGQILDPTLLASLSTQAVGAAANVIGATIDLGTVSTVHARRGSTDTLGGCKKLKR